MKTEDENIKRIEEEKLEKFCYEHDIDCDYCQFNKKCYEYYGKYNAIPMERYKRR